jgi:peptidoglycan/xylan/chitin deacetylase (PgdA/CDA1 family)
LAAVACLLICALTVPGERCDAAGRDALASLFASTRLIKKGDKGDLVRSLQEVLDTLGYDTESDGVFGEGTKASLADFQKENDLHSDGVAGPSTLKALSALYYKKNPPETHTVKSGETLSSIADRYALSVNALLSMNRLYDADTIYAGQVLSLHQTVPPEEPVTEPDPVLDPATLPAPALPAPTRRVCLSFDDGPDVYTTRQILAVLQTYGIKATFFLVGDRAARNPDLVEQIAAAGHIIGVHGYDHKVLSGLSASEIRRDLQKARDAVAEVTKEKPWLYRPPAGVLDRTQVDEANKLGLTTLMWTNIGGADLGATSAEEVTARIIQGAKDGGVILMHEGLQHTVEALPSIIESLARLGFGFQNVSQPAR